MAELPTNHEEMCRTLGVPYRQPTDNPIVGKATEISILVEGKQVKKWGGSARCLYCDYEVSMEPDIPVCPKCGAGSAKDPIPVTCPHCGSDGFMEPGHPSDALLHCVQCGRSFFPLDEEE